MKTLFVNPNNRNPMGGLAAVEPPFWLSLMASHYLEDGKDIQVLDAEAENLSLDQTVNSILTSKATEVILVVMGNNPSVSSTPKMPVTTALFGALTPHYNKVWLTGMHPMAIGGKSVLNWQPTKCLPLHWELLPMHLYRAHNWQCLDGSRRSPYASIYTSLGCPFDCYYCNIHTLYKDRRIVYRGVPSILLEVDTLVTKYDVRNIKIWDELFGLKENRVLSICSGLKAYDLNLWAYARVDTITQRMLEDMKQAGIKWLCYGFENASSDVRQISNKRFSDNQMERAISWTREVGINILANFMFGLPGETEESAKQTLDFAKEHLFEFVNFYVALPYPGSQWYREAQPGAHWEDFNQYAKVHSISTSWWDWWDFKELAFREYFNNNKYLEMVRHKFGEQGVNQIKDMLGHSIQAGG